MHKEPGLGTELVQSLQPEFWLQQHRKPEDLRARRLMPSSNTIHPYKPIPHHLTPASMSASQTPTLATAPHLTTRTEGRQHPSPRVPNFSLGRNVWPQRGAQGEPYGRRARRARPRLEQQSKVDAASLAPEGRQRAQRLCARAPAQRRVCADDLASRTRACNNAAEKAHAYRGMNKCD